MIFAIFGSGSGFLDFDWGIKNFKTVDGSSFW